MYILGHIMCMVDIMFLECAICQLDACKEFRQNMMMKNLDKIVEGKKAKQTLQTMDGDR